MNKLAPGGPSLGRLGLSGSSFSLLSPLLALFSACFSPDDSVATAAGESVAGGGGVVAPLKVCVQQVSDGDTRREDDDDVDGCQQTVSRRVYSIFPQHFSQRYIQHNHSRPLTFFTGAPLGCPYPLPPYPPFGECPWP